LVPQDSPRPKRQDGGDGIIKTAVTVTDDSVRDSEPHPFGTPTKTTEPASMPSVAHAEAATQAEEYLDPARESDPVVARSAENILSAKL
jgi:hypothetical protein